MAGNNLQGVLTPVIKSIPAGTGVIAFVTTIDPAHLIDPSKFIVFEIDASSDGGLTWNFIAGFTWQGDPNWNTPGPDGLIDPGPWIAFDKAEVSGKMIRTRVNIKSPVNFSAKVEY